MYFLDNCGGLGSIINLIKQVLNIALILIGVILVVLIIIDIAKAIIAGDEKEVKASQKNAIRRLIYGVVIFFVVTIVTAVFNLLGNTGDKNIEAGSNTNWTKCWNDPLCTKNPDKCIDPNN